MDYQAAKALLESRGFESQGADALILWLQNGADNLITLYRHGRATSLWVRPDGEFISDERDPRNPG